MSSAIAQQTPSSGPLTLNQCIALAKAAPSTVKRAKLAAEAGRLGTRSAIGSFLPQLSISNTFTYNSPLLYDRRTFSFVALNGIHEYASLGTATLDVDTSGRLLSQLGRARANQRIAEANLAISGRDLERSVAQAYYHLLLARHLAAAAHANLDTARNFESIVQKLVNGEEASRADLNKATLETSLMERTALSSDLEAEMANHDLASYWTNDVTTPLTLAEDLNAEPAAPLHAMLDKPFLKRPEFRLLDAQAYGFRADARQSLSRMLPQLSATFQYGIDSNRVTWRDRGYAGIVHLEIPVFDWLRNRSEQRSFQLQAKQAEIDKAIAQRTYSKEYQDALASVNANYAQIAVADRELKAAEENLRLSKLRFQAGEGLALDVVSAQTSFAQAQIDFYSARANYLNAQSALKVASGQ
ncbi:MAG: TolC family protein [Acidobacteria bacterium]|nr:TolC family protein [Acidobacteriota bacterium]